MASACPVPNDGGGGDGGGGGGRGGGDLARYTPGRSRSLVYGACQGPVCSAPPPPPVCDSTEDEVRARHCEIDRSAGEGKPQDDVIIRQR